MQTIEARELCGGHVGRFVLFRIAPDAGQFGPAASQYGRPDRPVLAGELAHVAHDHRWTVVSLRGFGAGQVSYEFRLDLGDQVVIDAVDLDAIDLEAAGR